MIRCLVALWLLHHDESCQSPMSAATLAARQILAKLVQQASQRDVVAAVERARTLHSARAVAKPAGKAIERAQQRQAARLGSREPAIAATSVITVAEQLRQHQELGR